ncbi:hypothetical protein BDV36DRAFT_246427 [Aspergillus pseudocaelatus]|uniref:Uncharacterized protein n=1 Tax=Aspergillus pseudocaelatus TaxID=1825620 RepID=A0ABQ6WY25_9EURO|nr:hypothetical protein BDV36DRAFT_246427 [Aspergillus pseudocaelatus]
MVLLHHPLHQKVAISENVLTAAIANDGYDNRDKVVKFLLSHHGAPAPVSERMILAAVESYCESKRKIEMLLKQYQGPICIGRHATRGITKIGRPYLSKTLGAPNPHRSPREDEMACCAAAVHSFCILLFMASFSSRHQMGCW